MRNPSAARVLRGHLQSVGFVQPSLSGMRLLSGDSIGQLIVWDFHGGVPLETLQCDGVERAILSQNARFVAGWGPASVFRTWNARSGELIRTFRGHTNVITAIEFTPWSGQLVSSSRDGSLIEWDLDTGNIVRQFGRAGGAKPRPTAPDARKKGDPASTGEGRTATQAVRADEDLQKLDGHAGPVRDLVVLPDSRRVVSAGDDPIVFFWEIGSSIPVARLFGHHAPIVRLAAAPDERYLASVDSAGTAIIWDIQNRNVLHQLQLTDAAAPISFSADSRFLAIGATTGVRLVDVAKGTDRRQIALTGHRPVSLAFTPEGELVAGCTDHKIRVWSRSEIEMSDASNGVSPQNAKASNSTAGQRGLQLLTGAGQEAQIQVNSVAFAPRVSGGTGLHFATGDTDGSITTYDILQDRTINRSRRLAGHLKPVNHVAYSPDGTRLAAASDDGTVSVWDVRPGREIRRLRGHVDVVLCCAFSADGSRILSGGRDGIARVWDVLSETEIKQIKLHQVRTWTQVLTWGPDGDRFFAGARSNGAASGCLASIEAARELFAFQEVKVPVQAAAFTRDGTQIVAIAARHNQPPIIVWDAATGQKLREFGSKMGTAVVSSDGARVFGANERLEVEIWDTSQGTLLETVKTRQSRILAMALSSDGLLGLTVAGDGTFELVDLPEPPPPERQVRLFQHDSPVECLAFSPDGYLALAGDAASLRVWNLDDPTLSYSYPIRNRVTAAGFSADNGRIVYATGQPNSTANSVGLKIQSSSGRERLNYQDRDIRRFEPPSGRYTAAFFFDADRRVATANADGMVQVWSVQTAANELTCGVQSQVNGMAMFPDQDRVLLAVNDKDVRVWSLRRNEELARFRGHTFHVLSVALTPDGKRAASASGDRTARVWNAETGDSIAELRGHSDRVNSVAISADGESVLSGSNDGSVRLWNVTSGEIVLRLDGHVGPVNAVAFSPDVKRGLSAGDDNTVRLWNLDVTSGAENK